MGLLIDIFLYVLYVIVMSFIMFCALTKIIEGKNEFIDNIIEKIKNGYEYFRQCIYKKSNKVNDNSGTVYNGPEFFDSSSEWED